MIMPHRTPTSSCWCRNRTTGATGRLIIVDLHVDRRIIKKGRGPVRKEEDKARKKNKEQMKEKMKTKMEL